MGRFAKAGQVDQYGKGEYFANLSAKYRVRILECKAIEAREAGLATVIEVEVREIILDPPEARDHEGKPKARVGDVRAWYLDMRKDAAWPDLQAFLALAHDIDKDTLEQMKRRDKAGLKLRENGQETPRRHDEQGDIEEVAEWTVGPEQPLRGLELIVHTFNRNTQKKNKPFTVHRWYSVDGLRSTEDSENPQ